MKKTHRRVVPLLLSALLLLCACGAGQEQLPSQTREPAPVSGGQDRDADTVHEEEEMKLSIDNTEVPVIWEDNDSVQALRELVLEGALSISMSMYGGFEQVGAIGQSITRADAHTTARTGDIMLYSGDQIVIFYGSNSWVYTRLGHVDLSAEEMTALLGSGSVKIKLSLGEQ